MHEHSRNLELKVWCPQEAIDAIGMQVESLTCTPIQRLHQVDTYFRVERGRLKLRVCRADPDPAQIEQAELIAHARPSDDGSR